ncbi:hypothetical protein HPB52_011333 [Rhipicephalus sanguineus]|uniref:Uncharacterized protein n=1 Tax=Rhipicephalus sanguineus TaxID=34632 RepID=A0A9D4PKG8_RHISA|nr:hypothetical protein HPB52_011333 [Rhipicephalus sanguineus]
MAHQESYNELLDLDLSGPLDSESVQGATGYFTEASVGCKIPCTASDERTCQIVHHLTACNKWLFYNQSQLRESAGKRSHLSLVACPSPFLSTPTADLHRKRRQANIFLNQLLKTHRCIGEIDLILFPRISGAFDRSPELLCDALSQNSSVKVLKLNLNHNRTHEDLCALISSLVGIEELECEHNGFCPAPLLSALSALLRATLSLTILKIPELRFDETQAEQFLSALAANSTLKELSIREYEPMRMCPSLVNRSAFADFLSTTCTLNNLTITIPSSPCYPRARNHWPWILEGLVDNGTIQNVSLGSVILDGDSFALIARIFAQNKVIRTFGMASKRQRPESRQTSTQYESMSERRLQALDENDTLENLRLCFDVWTTQQWKRFFRTLMKKKNMRIATVEVTIYDRPLLPELCKMLRETGAQDKVSLGHCYVGEERGIVECKAFSRLLARRGQYAKEELCGILKLLPSLRHVKFLSLDIAATDLDAGLCSAIAECITVATALEELHLTLRSDEADIDAAEHPLKAILASLARNKSFKHLSVLTCHLQSELIEHLADVIKLNIQAYLDWFDVLEVTRRNSGLLVRAAAFVSGARQDRYSACALELMFRHPALPEEVSKQASLSEADAATMVHRALERIQDLDEYMRLSGVVRVRVVCCPCDGARVQLDNLDGQSWAAVRRYLTISDVKESSSIISSAAESPGLHHVHAARSPGALPVQLDALFSCSQVRLIKLHARQARADACLPRRQ